MVRVQSEALVVRSVAYGESDAIVTLLTEAAGKLGVMVRGGRKSTKRVGGALEPFHTIEVTVDDKGGEHLGVLREARIVVMRNGIVASLESLEAAGTGLRWARHLFPARTRELEGWGTVVELLDRLDRGGALPRVVLAGAGLRLLAAVGYALDLERCVRCGKEAPRGRAAYVDGAHGGLVCRACGGARRILEPGLLAIARALQRGEEVAMGAEQASDVLALVDDAMAAHAGFEK